MSARQDLTAPAWVIHQWVLALGTNTLLDLANCVVCPLCKIANESAGQHRIPRIFRIGETTLFDYDGGFNVRIYNLVKHTNVWSQLCSEGGCSHAVLCGLAVAVHAESAEGFPVEIGGKGANPPYCTQCHVLPAPICVRDGDAYAFFCPNCFRRDEHPHDALVIDLTAHFFTAK
jgi:hypothetical protein